jgi:hypothetical protein
MARKPVNVDRDRHIAELRRTGAASLEEIAKDYNISTERVRQITARAGISNADAAAAYAKAREEEKLNAAEDHASAILMRWIGTENIPEIAKDIGVPIAAAQAILDEQVTDEINAARLKNMTAKRFPEAKVGPRADGDARDDRHWTYDATLAALVRCAEENGGRLPSSTKYKVIGSERDDMPSFPTVRNRIGRWSQVRILVNNKLKSNN